MWYFYCPRYEFLWVVVHFLLMFLFLRGKVWLKCNIILNEISHSLIKFPDVFYSVCEVETITLRVVLYIHLLLLHSDLYKFNIWIEGYCGVTTSNFWSDEKLIQKQCKQFLITLFQIFSSKINDKLSVIVNPIHTSTSDFATFRQLWYSLRICVMVCMTTV